MRINHTESIKINAGPEKVYSVVSNIPLMGVFSPECYKCEWLYDAKGPGEGVYFRGYNRQPHREWNRKCQIIEAKPSQAFIFQVKYEYLEFLAALLFGISAEWSYRMEAIKEGTLLIESYDMKMPKFIWNIVQRRYRHERRGELQESMKVTLTRIKDYIEKNS